MKDTFVTNLKKIDGFFLQSRPVFYFMAFALVSLSLLSLTSFLNAQYKNVYDLNNYTYHEYEALMKERRVLTDLLNMETGVRGYLLSGDEVLLEPYETAAGELAVHIQDARDAAKKSGQDWLNFDSFNKIVNQFVVILEREVAEKRADPSMLVNSADLLNQKTIMDGLRSLILARIDEQVKDIEAKNDINANKSFRFTLTIVLGDFIFISLFLALTIIAIRAEIRMRATQKNAETNERLYKIALDGVKDRVFEYDIINRKVRVSSQKANESGPTEFSAPIGVDEYRSYIHPEDLERSGDVIDNYLSSENGIYENIFRMRDDSGQYAWVLSRGVVSYNARGEAEKIVGVHIDITSQKEREIEVQRLKHEMESYIHITSHDLRSPLVNLKGFSRELEYSCDEIKQLVASYGGKIPADFEKSLKGKLEGEFKEAITFINNSIDRLDALTKAILDLSRIGRYEFKHIEVDSDEIISRVIKSMRYEVEKTGAKITAIDMPHIISDPVAIEQIFGNLLDNAVKYLDPARTGIVEVSYNNLGEFHQFAFKDNGRGIDEADHHKVFDPFRRARNVGNVRGIGMGMAFVRATLRKLGGEIRFESEPGSGTTFFIILPKTYEE